MNVLLQTYYILLPIIATSLLGWVGVLLKSQRKKEAEREQETRKKEDAQEQMQKANSVGIMLVLRYMLKRYHVEYMMQSKITYNQYKEWIELFKAYADLGGNSIAEEWNEDIENMEKCESMDERSPFELMLEQGIKRED
ncbi:MAG: hypothetical protein Q4P20_12480 [Eubacteriales bacterium]|nr:hypothetical protein [Eubacteriales bacterium]